MPRSAGTYTLYTPGNPVVTGTSISSAWANNTLNDIASAITQSWPRDGTAPPTANQPMGGFKFTGLAAGSALTDSVTLGQVQNSAPLLITGVAGADTITGSIVTPTLAAYATGQRFNFVAAAPNTGAATININSLGAKALTKNGAAALVAGDLVSGTAYSIFYDGTQFQVANPSASGVSSSQVQAQTFTAFTTTGTGTAYVLTPTPAISAYTAGLSFFITFNAASGAAPTLAISGVATPPSLVKQNPDGSYSNISAGDFSINHRSRVTLLSATQAWVEELPPVIGYGTLTGLSFSTAGSSATFATSSGQAADSTNGVLMTLGSAISKTTSAWAVGTGNGGLDTGSIANNTSYHAYLIRRPDTGVVDVVFSLSASAPTLPTNYTQYRRIFSMRTNASAQWVQVIQDGDLFQLFTPVLDIDVSNPGTTAVTRTLASIPTGIRVGAIFNAIAADTTNANNALAYFSDLSVADLSASTTVAPLASSSSASAGLASATTAGGAMKHEVMTNTSAQIRSRVQYPGATTLLKMATLGWRDTRGRQ